MKKAFPSVALVYDRVNTPYGGAENVLVALHTLFPNAPLFTSLYDSKNAQWARAFSQVIPSFLNYFPFLRQQHRWLAWLMPFAFEMLDLSAYDIVISVTSAEAKGVLTSPHQLHICYLLTPPRYLYEKRQHSLDAHWLLRWPIIRDGAEILLDYLHWWDQAAAFRPDILVPISNRVKARSENVYPGVAIHPTLYPPVSKVTPHKPVEMAGLPKEYFLIISRLVSHKHLDIAVKACLKVGKNLIIVGSGPEKERLQQLASMSNRPDQFIFFDSARPELLHALFTNCQAVLMPGEEDFGIVALEANAFGKPVLIHAKSGAAELIKPKVHGVHIADSTVTAVIDALHSFERVSFSARKIAQNPVQYSTDQFLKRFKQLVEKAWETHLKENHEPT